MRENEPVYWDEVNELWGISRYDDIVAIERDKTTFINSDQIKGGYRPNIAADPSIIGLDDPHHTARRKLVSHRFTPRAVTSFEDHVREVVVGLLDGLPEDGRAVLGAGGAVRHLQDHDGRAWGRVCVTPAAPCTVLLTASPD